MYEHFTDKLFNVKYGIRLDMINAFMLMPVLLDLPELCGICPVSLDQPINFPLYKSINNFSEFFNIKFNTNSEDTEQHEMNMFSTLNKKV